MKPIKVTHIISGLSTGGAEMMLYKLASHNAQSGTLMEHNIISLTDAKGYLTDRIQSLGIPVVSLGLELKNPLSFSGLLRMAHLLRRIKPDLIQGWMYHGNFISATASGLIAKNKPLVWNIRHSLDDIRTEKHTTRIVIYLNRVLSPSPQRIIYNSRVSKFQHENYGFSPKNSSVIPNGIDSEIFKIFNDKGDHILKELNIPESAQVVGHIARLHPMKNHAGLIASGCRVLEENFQVHFILVGPDVTQKNTYLTSLIPEKFRDNFHLLGERHDLPAIYNALDIFCLPSSWGEGWPNVLGEALACGVPCLATDVGDSKAIVDQYGVIVPPGDLELLTRGLTQMINMPKARLRAMGRQGRKHIESNYELRDIVRQYHALYEGVLAAWK